ncbi:MAG: DUF748 domain-containing protein [Planctomycetota bacterium]
MLVRFLIRKLVWLLAGLVALVVLAAIGLNVAVDRLVRSGLETTGPLLTGVPVQVRDVHLSILGGSFTVEGFEMGNPEGFKGSRSLAAGRIHVEAKLASLFSDEVVLPLVEVEEPEVVLELSEGKTNLGQIIEKIESLRPESSERRLRIGRMQIRGARVGIAGLPAGQDLSFSLPDVVITDLQTGGESATAQQVASKVLRALLDDVLAEATGGLASARLDSLQEELDEALRLGRDVLGEDFEDLERAAEKARKELETLLK